MMRVDSLYSGGVIANYHCSSRCGHCLYNCGPERSHDYISAKMAEKIFSVLKAQACHSIHVGGGEPFLNFQGLLDFTLAARTAGITIEYIETNSSWFKSHDDAVIKLDKLLEAGISCLLLSVSPFHNEYIPLSKFNGVLAACRETGMQVFPWIGEFYQELARMDNTVKHSLGEYQKLFGAGAKNSLMSRYSLTMRGRALESFRDQLTLKPYGSLLESSDPCYNLQDTSHFHIDLYANYIPGLCTGMAVALDDLANELNFDKYPVICSLYEAGIKGLASLAEKQGWSPHNKNYVSKCDICTEIRHYLVKQNFSPIELAPTEFYNEYI